MKVTHYVPIYQWSDTGPDSVNGTHSGTMMYSSLQDLYGFEPEAIAHFEVTGEIPTENEFKKDKMEAK